ncbi:uncharacterized protein BXZ73DRAFT_105272 [Epithele typhae]|uniref:uncharacterized protein n=1 Tax=Epithele typhae TaxID=378194 RepID=UPI002008B806|nr:uncharacterized protein BXZ73DRAFT_105272 [Epithele typhae]KAH9918394.1 hypothetical protein BXZ73DRAFT_105272 [Epithele typhae]
MAQDRGSEPNISVADDSEDDFSDETEDDWNVERPPPSGPAWAPQAHLYAVAHMDPVSMVQHLNDPFALEAAQQLALRTKTYLIYIDHVCGFLPTFLFAYMNSSFQCLALPLGVERWFLFQVTGIATTPPPACEAENRGPEVCVPIFPSDTHPTGRAPLRTEPTPFPFPNCFHWALDAMSVRVLPRTEGWNDSKAIRLTGLSQVVMGVYWQYDEFRCRDPTRAYKMQEKLARSERVLGKKLQESASSRPGDENEDVPADSEEEPEEESDDEECDVDDTCDDQRSAGRHLVEGRSEPDANPEHAAEAPLPLTDVFLPNLDEEEEYMPILQMKYELTEYIRREDIPDPSGLYAERDEIVRIIKESYARSFAVYTHEPETSETNQPKASETAEPLSVQDAEFVSPDRDRASASCSNGTSSDHGSVAIENIESPTIKDRVGVQARESVSPVVMPVPSAEQERSEKRLRKLWSVAKKRFRRMFSRFRVWP